MQFILERTIGPQVIERVGRFKTKAEAWTGDHRSKVERLDELTRLDPAIQLLELKIFSSWLILRMPIGFRHIPTEISWLTLMLELRTYRSIRNISET